MELLATLGIVIAVMVGLGKFLDTQHLEVATIDKIRVRLVAFYVWLYEAPLRLKKRFRPFIERFDKLHEPPPFDIRTGQLIEKRGRPATSYIFQLIVAVLFPILIMRFHHFDPNEDVSAFNLPRDAAWWWAIMAGVVMAALGPLFLIFSIGLWALIVTLPSLLVLAAVEMIRRALLIILDKGTSPRTSPFAYFSGLASVVLAVGEGLNKLTALW